MTEEGPGYEWLDAGLLAEYVRQDTGTPTRPSVLEAARAAAAQWCQDQRPDLLSSDGFTPTPRVIQAGLLLAARLSARGDSPTGVVGFAELGAAIIRRDPDIVQMIGRPTPKVG